MIKLVVSDIDGTLLPYGETALPQALFPLIRGLERRGIRFCPASGRQFHSLRRLFGPVEETLTYLCENGAILYGPGREEAAPVLHQTPLPRAAALALCRDILALPRCELLVSGPNCSYLTQCSPSFVAHMRGFKGNRVEVVEEIASVNVEILKVSAYCPQGTGPAMAALGPRWGEEMSMAVAGADWLDFTLADKGVGLRGLCRALGVPLEEVAAFGDNWNDVSMLEAAGHPYLMAQADPVLKERFPRQCESVLTVLEHLVDTGRLPEEA